MALRLKTDWILFTTTILLVFFGALVIYSASSVKAEQKLGSSIFFIERQIFWVILGLGVMMLLKRMSYKKLQNSTVAFAAMGIVVILLWLVYLADPRQHRWIKLAGMSLQPSELAKPALAIFLAFFIALRSRAINNRHTLLPAALAVGLVTISVVVADLGTAIVLYLTATVMFFVAGLEKRYIAMIVGIALLGAISAVIAKPYRLARIIPWVDPDYKLIDRFDPQGRIKSYMKRSLVSQDTKYQVQQSIIAIGSGGVEGMGLMQGKQKLLYLPEAHTDFIFAVVGEEFGLIGTISVLLGFVIIFWRGIRAAVLVPDEFGRYLAIGITVSLSIQALMNMIVVLGLVPTKGIPLPMISYGGTSLLSTLAMIGVLLNVSEHAG